LGAEASEFGLVVASGMGLDSAQGRKRGVWITARPAGGRLGAGGYRAARPGNQANSRRFSVRL